MSKRLTSLEGRCVVVTGAASGIGAALAVELAGRGADLALADIDRQGLERTAASTRLHNVHTSTHIIDVAQLAEVERLRQEALTEHRMVDAVINNAGVALVGGALECTMESMRWLMDINFWGVVHGCRVFGPGLLERPEGAIVNISSVYGLIGPPERSAYAAAKHAVKGYTDALRHELAPSRVLVMCVHPGGIRTPIVEHARIESARPLARAELARQFEAVARTSAPRAAQVIVEGLLAGRERLLIGADARIVDVLQRLRPLNYMGALRRLLGPRQSSPAQRP